MLLFFFLSLSLFTPLFSLFLFWLLSGVPPLTAPKNRFSASEKIPESNRFSVNIMVMLVNRTRGYVRAGLMQAGM